MCPMMTMKTLGTDYMRCSTLKKVQFGHTLVWVPILTINYNFNMCFISTNKQSIC